MEDPIETVIGLAFAAFVIFVFVVMTGQLVYEIISRIIGTVVGWILLLFNMIFR